MVIITLVMVINMDLLKFLKSNNNVRKIFGERELKIIEKQILGINLTQSEKNRLSRDIRKKFEFIKEAIKFSEDFELKKGTLNKKIINEAKEIILNSSFHNKIKRIFLFGSIIENQLTFRSDIDLAVEFSEISLEEATLFRKNILRDVNPKIDIQVYNHLPDKIIKEIKTKGKILYERKNQG